jgi:hypothetical protein
MLPLCLLLTLCCLFVSCSPAPQQASAYNNTSYNRGGRRQSVGTTNPLFIETLDEPTLHYMDAEAGYQELPVDGKGSALQFNNPLYHGQVPEEGLYDQSKDDNYLSGYDVITSAPGFAGQADYAYASTPGLMGLQNSEYLGFGEAEYQIMPGSGVLERDLGYMMIDPTEAAAATAAQPMYEGLYGDIAAPE